MTEAKYTGHLPNSGWAVLDASTGGLQGHSIGGSYPFAVVGCQVLHLGDTERTSESTRFYVICCVTGQIYARRASGSTFYTSLAAHEVAACLARGESHPDGWGVVWNPC
ncbi:MULTISPECIES: hypothetical protein [Burkholderia]|uniref:hypothetical protein n=1 Tax=Burkholderia TaxID=32008 RepID=UPI00075DD179|nr:MULTISPECIES: hypothetical protein [Burkholderia]AOJ69197.1 hypothetical protein WS78_10840 [Burkholderia savannae]KVG39836.1 hypothetical protein WS77_19390 [Burkholderia sp. MSMB0265]KVG85752.1 hypothetical protein WS81_31285 [Burkholderia sp. MSMB2040]KVG92232.1 hypothetical protein WS82_12365 [Burkholderia sp. MSMB2041]KVG95689.1 hypothetical protein WS83_03870 [Burkholderia sp. MSMB2042]